VSARSREVSRPGPESMWANPLVRHLALVLLAKLLLLTLLWLVFFRLPDDPASRLTDIHTHIAGPVVKAMSHSTD
jgi:hypothetical protein